MESKAGHMHLALWGGVVTVLLLMGIAIQQYWAMEQQKLLAGKTVATVNNIRANSGNAIPFVLNDLKSLPPRLVHDELRARYAEATGQQKLSLAYSWASIGQVNVGAIVRGIRNENTQGAEVANIVAALKEKDTQVKALSMI